MNTNMRLTILGFAGTMVIRNIVKLLVATGEAVGKAFSRAVREEINGIFIFFTLVSHILHAF